MSKQLETVLLATLMLIGVLAMFGAIAVASIEQAKVDMERDRLIAGKCGK